MLRAIVWLSGAVALGYVAYRFAAWRVFFQVSLVWLLLLWVIVGGWLLARPGHARGQASKPSPADIELLHALSVRQAYADKHGEDMAVKAERNNPHLWREIVRTGERLP